VNIQGEIVFNGSNQTQIDLSDLGNGMYYINFITDSEIVTKKVIIIK
jgi:hypothetical protein